MDTCPSCGNVTNVASKFCPRCGQPMQAVVQAPSPGPVGTVRVGDTSVESNAGAVGANLAPDVLPRAQELARRAGQELDIGQGPGPSRASSPTYDVGDKKYVFTIPEEVAVYCRICGVRFHKDVSRLCPECGRVPLCPADFDAEKKLCSRCAEKAAQKATIHCVLCGQQVPQANTFECPECRRVVGKEHLHTASGKCQPCAEEYEKFVASLRSGEPVVAGPDGKLFTPEDADKGTLVAERGKLRTAEGEQVAKLKDQMWYSPQWFRLRQKRFQEEQEAMKTFYPHMELKTAPSGEAYWKGQLTTRLGKAYMIELHYPSAFPYLPPKAYVTSPPIKKSLHIYEDGHLCLFHRDDRTWDASTTAATVVSWVAKWLHCYEVWLATGDWPGKAHDQLVVTVRS